MIAASARAELDALAGGRYVRAINYHNTPRRREAELERRLRDAGERFDDVGEAELEALLSGEPWAHPKPGLIPAFFEGYRNNYDVALPLLERAGLCGWFIVPTAFIDTPVERQREMAVRHRIGVTEDEHGDGRYAMTWDELREIADRGHVVTSHTASHCGVTDIATEADARRELVDSRRRLESELGRQVRCFTWLWGTPYGHDERTDAALRAAGYRLVLSATKLQRIPSA